MKLHQALSALLLAILTGSALAWQEAPPHFHGSPPSSSGAPRPTPQWSESTLRSFEALPIQEGGRIKPLRTFADFSLLRLNGKRSFSPPDAESDDDPQSASAWLLTVLLHPDVANHFETFMVPDDEAIQALGLTRPDGKKKRDRYSYAFLSPARERLRELARQIDRIDKAERSSTQQHIYELFGSLNQYERLAGAFDFSRLPYSFESLPDAASLFEDPGNISFVEMVERYPDLQVLYATLAADPARSTELDSLGSILRTLTTVASTSRMLPMFPPVEQVSNSPQDREWFAAEDILALSSPELPAAPEHLDALRTIATLSEVRDNDVKVGEQLEALLGIVRTRAELRGEYEKVPLELSYYRAKLITRSLVMFLIAFVLGSLLWLVPKSRILHRSTMVAAAGGSALLIAAIVMRCLIQERPPVTTLYETLLFVTAVGTAVALLVETLGGQRIAITVGSSLGAVGLFMANGYEKLDKVDTMPSLVAVLDTNFYLAIHVTTVTIGYSAGILGALLGSVYILSKALGFKRNEPSFLPATARMTYGVVCFGLLFSIFGTIMGGIWANDSWGRFWGWDPKENGALLICLANIAILHLRAGGYIRDLGLCIAAAFTGIIVVFSWFHVNLLGVGLHAYGFTSGIKQKVLLYYGIQGFVVVLGALIGWLERTLAHPAAASATVQLPEKVQLPQDSPGA